MRKTININCWCKKYYVYPSHKSGVELANPYKSQPENIRETLSDAISCGLALIEPVLDEEIRVFFIDDNHLNYIATLIAGEEINEFIWRLMNSRVRELKQFGSN